MTAKEIWNELKTSNINVDNICEEIYLDIMKTIKCSLSECEKSVCIKINIDDYIDVQDTEDIVMEELRKKIKDNIVSKIEKENYIFKQSDLDDSRCLNLEFYLFKTTKEQEKNILRYDNMIQNLEKRCDFLDKISTIFSILAMLFLCFIGQSTIISALFCFTLSISITSVFISVKKEKELDELKSIKLDYLKTQDIVFYTKDNFDIEQDTVWYGIK